MAEYQHPEQRNVLDALKDGEGEEIGAEALEDFKRDEDSLSEWSTMHADWLDMYYQQDIPANPPWEGSSGESIPILAEAVNMFHSRAFLAMFGQPQLVRAVPTGQVREEDEDRAERVGLHITWQLMHKDPYYKKNKDRLIHALALHGSFFTKSYYDPVLQRNVVENVRPTDFIVPYGIGPREVEDLERKTHVLYMSKVKANHLHKQGFFSEMPEEYAYGEENELQKAHDEAHGIQDNNPTKSGCVILEQHTWLDLDDDGLEEPYIVWIDKQSGKILRIAIRWQTDELGRPADEWGRVTERKRPVEYFTHYTFLDNPDGFYGLGLGHLLGPPNRAVNKLLRQTIDAATLATAGNMSGFISESVGSVGGGELDVTLGRFKKVTASGDDLNKGVFQFKFPGPSDAMYRALELLMARSDRLGTATESVTGQVDKALQPTTVLALLEESGRIFSAVNERLVTSWKAELEKLYRLNFMYMDEKEYYAVLDSDGGLKERQAARLDYAPDMQIQPTVDPRMTTQRQKISQAEVEWNFLSQNPLTMSSPTHIYNASRRFLRAISADNIDEVLPAPDPMAALEAVLASMGMEPDEIHAITQQIGLALLEKTAGDTGSDAVVQGAIQAGQLEDGQINGTGGAVPNGGGGSGVLNGSPGQSGTGGAS